MTPAATGGFMNYDLFVEHGSGDTRLSGSFETGVYTRFGVALNRFAGALGGGGSGLTRLDTSWTIDRPMHLNSLRIGDSLSRGGPGASPVRFTGFQFATNFAVQPGYITAPLPSVEGSAAVPSVVDVYVNNILQSSRNVSPGPFEITNVPVVSGGGSVQLVMRDVLGRETVSTHSYYASSQMLRRGLHDFSYEVGLLRRGYGTKSISYGELMASAAHRFGLSDSLTAEAYAQVSAGRQQLSTGMTAVFPKIALVNGWIGASRSGDESGWTAGAAIERRSAHLSVGARSEMSSAGYASVGEVRQTLPPKRSLQAFADMPLRGGSIGVNILHRDNRGKADETLIGAAASISVHRRASLQLYGQRVASGRTQTILGAHLTLNLGRRRSAAAGVELGGGAAGGYASVQQDVPFGQGTGYRAEIRTGQAANVRAQVDHRTDMGVFGLHLAHSKSGAGLRLTASGAVGAVGGDLFVTRPLGGSFGSVRVPGQAGVRVYADNQLVGTTGPDGTVIVPQLRPYERNVIRIEAADLPLDVQIEETERVVRPFGRAGTAIVFKSRRERGVLLRVLLPGGEELPAGAIVEVEGQANRFVAVSGGELYVPDLSGKARLRASWAGGTCSFAVSVPETDDPQPRIDGIRCVKEPRYAAL